MIKNKTLISAYAIPGLPELKTDAVISRDVIKAEKIIENICKYYDCTVQVVKGKRRLGDAVYIRQMCMWFIIQETKLSLANIGKIFSDRDHTTVIHARDSVKEQLFARHDNYYKDDYFALNEIALTGVVPQVGRPPLKKRKAMRKAIIHTDYDFPIEKKKKIERAKSEYTNTNHEQYLEERVRAFAI